MLGVSVNLTITLFKLQDLLKSPELCSGRLERLTEQGFEGPYRPKHVWAVQLKIQSPGYGFPCQFRLSE